MWDDFTWINKPSTLNCQERFLLTEVEMSDYELKNQYNNWIWIIGEGDQSHDAIRQIWHKDGRDYYVDYCEFDTETKALQGTAYAATRSNATPYIWGSLTGSIVKDGSWVAISDGALYFVRGNIGIKIFKPVNFNENDRQALVSISSKLLNKIESNLLTEVLSFEEAARQKQIPVRVYQTITNPVVNSEPMNGFSLHSTWDSKWLMTSESLAMGIRKEWKNEQGAIIGIDISRFDSDSLALKAGNTHSRITYSSIFNLDNLDSLKSILAEWQKKWGYGFPKNLFSVVGVEGNIAVHVYQFDSTGIATSFFYSIVEKLSEQIINF